jgi:hypothetical protein
MEETPGWIFDVQYVREAAIELEAESFVCGSADAL